jgi:3-phosphoshikimate 1-carboxyvinyltransferase
MQKTIKPKTSINSTISVPSDKSISHRALIIGSLCHGDVQISNLSTAADCYSTMSCMRNLGIQIDKLGTNNYLVKGKGLDGFSEPDDILNANNSGTTIRLLCGLLAGQEFYSVITGDQSLCKRPMKRIIDPLTLMGAKIHARDDNRKPPMTIIGNGLKPIEYIMPVASAQVKSAILLAGLFCEGKTIIHEKYPSRDHTEIMLKYLDADINSSSGIITLEGGKLFAGDIYIPGDISSAMFFIITAVLVRDSQITIKNVGLNPSRTGCIEVLKLMGAQIEVSENKIKNGELYGDIKASYSKLKGITITPDMIPPMVDEIPILALAATQAEGKTKITGAEDLRYKECDRLHAIATELKRLGAHIKENPDGLEIEGPVQLNGANVKTYDDHRMVMTMAVAGLISKGETTIENIDAVKISFPDFFTKLDEITN